MSSDGSKRLLIRFVWRSVWPLLGYAAFLTLIFVPLYYVPFVPLRAHCLDIDGIIGEQGHLRGPLREDVMRRVREELWSDYRSHRPLEPALVYQSEIYVPLAGRHYGFDWLFHEIATDILTERLGTDITWNHEYRIEGVAANGLFTCDALQALLIEGGAWAEDGPHRILTVEQVRAEQENDFLLRPKGLPPAEFAEGHWLNALFLLWFLSPSLICAFLGDRIAVWRGWRRWPWWIAAGTIGPPAGLVMLILFS